MNALLAARDVRIGAVCLACAYEKVPDGRGIAVLVNDSRGSTRGPCNRFLVGVLHGYRLNTLLPDLLTEDEARARAERFDIGLACSRLDQVLSWLRGQADTGTLPVGLLGTGNGAAVALRVAVQHPDLVRAVVSRGGRPDLAADVLPRVRAPTLLVVGGLDDDVARINRDAMRVLRCPKRLEAVTQATHRFEAPGALEAVAHLAGDWLGRYLR